MTPLSEPVPLSPFIEKARIDDASRVNVKLETSLPMPFFGIQVLIFPLAIRAVIAGPAGMKALYEFPTFGKHCRLAIVCVVEP